MFELSPKKNFNITFVFNRSFIFTPSLISTFDTLFIINPSLRIFLSNASFIIQFPSLQPETTNDSLYFWAFNPKWRLRCILFYYPCGLYIVIDIIFSSTSYPAIKDSPFDSVSDNFSYSVNCLFGLNTTNSTKLSLCL